MSRFLLLAAASASLSTLATSQIVTPFTINDSCNGATVSYIQNFFDDSPTGTGGFTGNGTAGFGVDTSSSPDSMFGHDVYWRLASDPANTVFYDDPSLPGDQGGTSANVMGDSAVVTWPDAANRGVISAEWTATVKCCGTRCGRLENVWRLTNLDPNNSIDVEFYAYADLDFAGFANNQTSAASVPDRHEVINPAAPFESIEFFGDGSPSLGYEMAPWPLLADTLNGAYAPFTGLSNTGLPFGPDDYTGVMGWAATIPAGGQVTFRYTFGLNCFTCNTQAAVQTTPDGNGPTISSNSAGVLGCPLGVVVSGATASTPGSILLGVTNSPVPLSLAFPSCTGSLAVSSPLGTAPLASDGSGTASIEFEPPTDLTFCGVSIFVQYGQLVISSPTCPILLSDTLGVTFGD